MRPLSKKFQFGESLIEPMAHLDDKPLDFIRRIVADDLASERVNYIVTRFPPEPNGYLHIGHAKAFSLDFDLAAEHGGHCYLRMDDTNPDAEEECYVAAISDDLHWLGYQWLPKHFSYASDYFERFRQCALHLIEQGLAYVDHLSSEEVNSYRGSPLSLGKDSPWRDRPQSESIELFAQMGCGELEEGQATLRARVDMQHANVHMRDPVIYRIKHKEHHRQGKNWHLYPMYDFAHPLEDAIEGVSHSLCSIEFENHRPFYNWLIDHLQDFMQLKVRPHQYEFARLNLSYTLLSKRYLRQLVESGQVTGWDDPRMPTLCGMRRRGFPAAALLSFVRSVGLTKTPSLIDVQYLYHHVRKYLNRYALRRIAVLEPLKVIIDNYPLGLVEQVELQNNPEDASAGKRCLPFSGELWIEASDFSLEPAKGYFRLALGREVRLKSGYYVTCQSIDYHSDGKIAALHCSYDPLSIGGQSPDGRKVRGTIHWLCASNAQPAEFRFFEHLFTKEDMSTLDAEDSLLDYLNPSSQRCQLGYVEAAALLSDEALQFLRNGYFFRDPLLEGELPVFNRVVGLKDSWQRQQSKK